jgi:hypothetical protein
MSKTPIVVAIALAALATGAGAAQADSLPNLGQYNYDACGPDPDLTPNWTPDYGLDGQGRPVAHGGEEWPWQGDLPEAERGHFDPETDEWIEAPEPDYHGAWATCIADSTKDYKAYVAEAKAEQRAAKRSKYTYCDTIRANPPLRMFGTLDVYARRTKCNSALRVARADDSGRRPGRGWKRTVHVDYIDDQYGPCIDAPWDAGCTSQGEWHRHSTWRKGRSVVKLVGNLSTQDEWQEATR